MTPEQIKFVAAKYVQRLRYECHLEPERYDPDELAPWETDVQLSHVLFLCEEIPKLIDAGRERKAERWLCFCQGVMWSQRQNPITHFKNDNR